MNKVDGTLSNLPEQLGLTARTIEGIKLNQKVLTGFKRRELAFDWVHMGTTPCKAGQLINAIRNSPNLLPPRSGHLGNWHDIAAGRAGAIDYNSIICVEEKAGYPLIYDFNMTENEDLTDGDWIYLPGSFIAGGQRKLLPLYTWKNGQFQFTDRTTSYLSPFVLTKQDDALTPLIAFHRQQFRHLEGYPFQSQAQMMLKDEALLRAILQVLIDEALIAKEPERSLALIVDRIVTISGIVQRAEWIIKDKLIYSGDDQFGNSKDLVEAIILPLLAAAKPHIFIENPVFFNRPMALCSVPLVSLILAINKTHLSISQPQEILPFNLHLHWGALGMAGYPPKKHGHFSGHVRYGRPLYDSVIRHFPEIQPVFFALLPSAIYLLWPHQAYPHDMELVENLLSIISEQTNHLISKSNLMVKEIDRIAHQWLEQHSHHISAYFFNRFSSRRSVFNQVRLPPEGRSLKPKLFDDLTLMQLSMLVGALIEKANTMAIEKI